MLSVQTRIFTTQLRASVITRFSTREPLMNRCPCFGVVKLLNANMLTKTHKPKALATLLAGLTGAGGVQRFYLYGKRDFWA